jgi:thiol:disulfide interchange protein DsbC
MKKYFLFLALVVLVSISERAMAQEAAIRKNISIRYPDFPVISEVAKTDIKGMYEVMVDTEIYYTDGSANYLFRGELLNTKTGVNITRDRIEKLTAIQFSKLPLQDAFVWSHGDGSRKIAVFSDPNCSFCKKFESELRQLKNVTVFTFLYPVLGPDSVQKSRAIWCAKERVNTWEEWMLKETMPETENASCDVAAVERNIALGQRLRISGTPTIFFEDGRRNAGLLQMAELEARLQAARSSQSLPRK